MKNTLKELLLECVQEGRKGGMDPLTISSGVTAVHPEGAGADAVFNVVFFVVLFSVVVQGLTLAPSARRLGVVEPPTPSERP